MTSPALTTAAVSRPRRPTEIDLRMAQMLAGKVVAAGRGQVRRVVMIGSRALGCARPDSDLDLVAIVELRSDAKRWNGADADAERDRIQSTIGPPPISTDLTVRSAEQFEEAKGIIGGVERLVETEGVVVYEEPLQRPARPRRRPDDVRMALVRAWLEASVNTVAHGVSAMRSGTPSRSAQAQLVVQSAGPDSAGALRFVVRPPVDDTDGSKSWARASRQAVTALEVFYQIEARKRDNVDHVLGLLDAFCPQLTSCLRTMIESHAVSLVATSSTVQLVMDALPGIRKSAWSANLRRKLNAATSAA